MAIEKLKYLSWFPDEPALEYRYLDITLFDAC